MLPKPLYESLKNQKQFDIVNKHGEKFDTSCFIAIFYPHFSSKHQDADPDQLYLGLKVSRKFAAAAVKRNLAKRRIRSAIQLINKTHNIKGALVVIPKKNFNKIGFISVKENFIKFLF